MRNRGHELLQVQKGVATVRRDIHVLRLLNVDDIHPREQDQVRERTARNNKVLFKRGSFVRHQERKILVSGHELSIARGRDKAIKS